MTITQLAIEVGKQLGYSEAQIRAKPWFAQLGTPKANTTDLPVAILDRMRLNIRNILTADKALKQKTFTVKDQDTFHSVTKT